MYTYYLLDHEYLEDEENLTGAFGHLLVYNPGSEEVELKGTVFFEDREPAAFTHQAPPRMTSESNTVTGRASPTYASPSCWRANDR